MRRALGHSLKDRRASPDQISLVPSLRRRALGLAVRDRDGRRDAVTMIMQERPPSLGWRPPTLCHIFSDRGLPDIDAELKKFTVNAWCAPERICDTHVADELSGPMWRPTHSR